MTPPAATVAGGLRAGATRRAPAGRGTRTGDALRSRVGAPAPRRVSGPARRKPAATAQRTRLRGMADARVLDRILRGRWWIPLIALGLMGIVFMQVLMLQLNAGIGRDVEAAAALERANAELRSQVATLEGNERIEAAARDLGMVVPSAGSFRYLTARKGGEDARMAARTVTAPKPVEVAQAPVTPVTPVTPAAAAAGSAPQATQPAPAPTATEPTPAPVATQPAPAPTATTAAGGAVGP